jgi:hypothetical protein
MTSTTYGQIYFLDTDLSAFPNQKGRILTCQGDGSELQTLVSDLPYLPDGITIDEEKGHIYWTNMGASMSNPTDGSIQRCDLDGSNIVTIIPQGQLHTPKQLTISRPKNGSPRLYFCDREGMRVMRCNLDGSNIEVLIRTGVGAQDRAEKCNWCVGITVDDEAGTMYWSQKGPSKGFQGRIFRAPTELKNGESPDARSDVELLLENLPEPIDLHILSETKTLYWTDRGDPPAGNCVYTVKIDGAKTSEGRLQAKPQILVRRLHEGIGLAVDEEQGRLFFADLAGGVYSANIDGSQKKTLFPEIGDCTGVAFSRRR